MGKTAPDIILQIRNGYREALYGCVSHHNDCFVITTLFCDVSSESDNLLHLKKKMGKKT